MTVLYYLNDVKRGGETAFPVADEKNINQTVWEAFKAIEVKGEFTHLSSALEFPSSLPANDTLKMTTWTVVQETILNGKIIIIERRITSDTEMTKVFFEN